MFVDRRRNRIWIVTLLFIICCFLLSSVTARRRRRVDEEQAERHSRNNNDMDDPPDEDEEVSYLIQYMGQEIYRSLDKRKYRFYIYMAIGRQLPKQEDTILFIEKICNVLYGLLILTGFLFFPRTYMLFYTLATLYVGPAIILVLLGVAGMSIAAFAFYPITSVCAMWMWFFMTSRIAQAIGQHLGLDRDKDGEVNMLDFLYYVAQTSWGRAIGLPAVYDKLENANRDPFREINRRLDEITKKVLKDGTEGNGTGNGKGRTPTLAQEQYTYNNSERTGPRKETATPNSKGAVATKAKSP